MAAFLVCVAVAACSDAGPEVVLVVEAPATEVVVGESLTLTASASGVVPAVTWTSSNPVVATVVGGVVEALRPGPVTITASAPDAVPGEVTLTVVERPGGYSASEIDYFTEIAFGAEFGTSQPILRRWRFGEGPRISIDGSPTTDDLVVVDSVIAEINRLAPVEMQIVKDSASLEMHFVPADDFQSILPDAPPGNSGLVWIWWDGTNHVYRSVILISTDETDTRRAHIIREELTQSLGLLRDSFRYTESIFYEGPSEVTEYLPVDRAVIEILHRPELRVGMGPDEAARVARGLIRLGGGPATAGSAAAGPTGAVPPTSGWMGAGPALELGCREIPGTQCVPGSAGGSEGRTNGSATRSPARRTVKECP